MARLTASGHIKLFVLVKEGGAPKKGGRSTHVHRRRNLNRANILIRFYRAPGCVLGKTGSCLFIKNILAEGPHTLLSDKYSTAAFVLR